MAYDNDRIKSEKAENLYLEGMTAYKNGNYSLAYEKIEELRKLEGRSSNETAKNYPGAIVALAYMAENGLSGKNPNSWYAYNLHFDLIKAGKYDGAADFVRLAAEYAEHANVCEKALEAQRTLEKEDFYSTIKYMPVLYCRQNISRYSKDHEPWFKGAVMELNEENVRKVLNFCVATNETSKENIISVNFINQKQAAVPAMNFDAVKLCGVAQHIAFLVGQVIHVHMAKKSYWDSKVKLVLEQSHVRYDGVKWTDKPSALYALYYLACAVGIIKPFSREQNNTHTTDINGKWIMPTYRPDDITPETMELFHKYMQLDKFDTGSIAEETDYIMCKSAQCERTDFFNSLTPQQQQDLKRIVLLRIYGDDGLKTLNNNQDCSAIRDVKYLMYKLDKEADPAVYNNGNPSDANITRVAASFIDNDMQRLVIMTS